MPPSHTRVDAITPRCMPAVLVLILKHFSVIHNSLWSIHCFAGAMVEGYKWLANGTIIIMCDICRSYMCWIRARPGSPFCQQYTGMWLHWSCRTLTWNCKKVPGTLMLLQTSFQVGLKKPILILYCTIWIPSPEGTASQSHHVTFKNFILINANITFYYF